VRSISMERALLYGVLLLAVLASGQGEDGASPMALQEQTDDGNMQLGEAAGSDAKQEGVELVGAEVSVGAPAGQEEGALSVEATLETGKRAMDGYEGVQHDLMARANQLRDIYAHPPQPAMGITYDKVPGVVFREKGIVVDRRARSECESVCNSFKSCLSYSYNTRDEECIWSMQSFKYSVDDMFYLKKKTASGSVTLEYEQIPGLTVPDQSGAIAGGTFEECKYECSKSAGCSGFAYSGNSKLCTSTKFSFIEFDADWDYYEKDLKHTKIPRESPPDDKLSEAMRLKLLFKRQADRMKKIRSEQQNKMHKKREALRQKTITNEQRLKKLANEQLDVDNKFQQAEMARKIITESLDETRKLYRKYLASDGKLADQLATAKTRAANAMNKEVKEKADIDVLYLSKKMITSRLQAKQMSDDIAVKHPQEVKAKLDFQLVTKTKQETDSQYLEDGEALQLSEARVNLAEKEKATQDVIAKIDDLKTKVAEVSQIKPFDEKKLEVYKEQLTKAEAKKKSALVMQKRFKAFVKRIIDKNYRKHEAAQKLVASKMKEKRTKRADEAKEKKIQDEKNAKDAAKKKKDAEVKSKKQAEASEKDREIRKAKEQGNKAAEKEEKQLAREEAEKAAQRAKHEKEGKRKAEENSVMIQREVAEKKDKAEKTKKELAQKYQELKNYERALELSQKAEDKAKEDKEKAEVKMERDQKGEKEGSMKAEVKSMGFERMNKNKQAREEAANKELLKEGQVKVGIRKKKKANNDCKNRCIAAGKAKEETMTPVFLGCYKDQEKTPAMSTMIAAFDVNTIQWCNQKCLANSPLNRFFGLQDNKCFCSEEKEKYDRFGEAHEDKCILPCSGDSEQLCGGPLVNRVFLIQVSAGTYEWGGYYKNASIPLAPQNFNFERAPCQCVGVPKAGMQKTLPSSTYEGA